MWYILSQYLHPAVTPHLLIANRRFCLLKLFLVQVQKLCKMVSTTASICGRAGWKRLCALISALALILFQPVLCCWGTTLDCSVKRRWKLVYGLMFNNTLTEVRSSVLSASSWGAQGGPSRGLCSCSTKAVGDGCRVVALTARMCRIARHGAFCGADGWEATDSQQGVSACH